MSSNQADDAVVISSDDDVPTKALATPLPPRTPKRGKRARANDDAVVIASSDDDVPAKALGASPPPRTPKHGKRARESDDDAPRSKKPRTASARETPQTVRRLDPDPQNTPPPRYSISPLKLPPRKTKPRIALTAIIRDAYQQICQDKSSSTDADPTLAQLITPGACLPGGFIEEAAFEVEKNAVKLPGHRYIGQFGYERQTGQGGVKAARFSPQIWDGLLQELGGQPQYSHSNQLHQRISTFLYQKSRLVALLSLTDHEVVISIEPKAETVRVYDTFLTIRSEDEAKKICAHIIKSVLDVRPSR